ncbi:MAG: formylglycine-generating enzyme family protein, partial [Nitrospirae bacterium]|nr:formylglycine-generating enzyme family protein [Nitrospirota bacterium]
SHFKDNGDNFPVENVSWYDAQEFIEKLNCKLEDRFCLPTEAQWEYVCRSGGMDETYSGGEDIDSVAWYRSNSGLQTHEVGKKSPNGLGIYDMSGNVWEWSQDDWDATGSGRIVLGGSWFSNPVYTRCCYRTHYGPAYHALDIGFRLVKTI